MRLYEWLRMAAYVICADDDGRVLLTRWIDGDRPQWTLPGGGLDHGEHPQVGALRELTEETGYTGHLDELIGVDIEHFIGRRRPPEGYDAVDIHAVRIVYRGQATGGELRHEVGGSTDRAEWVPRDQVAALDAVSLVRAGMAMLDSDGSAVEPVVAVPVPSSDLPEQCRLAVHGLAVDDGNVSTPVGVRPLEPRSLPGGDVEHGEDPRAVLARLFEQQTGQAVTAGPLRAAASDVGDDDARGVQAWTVRLVYDVTTTPAPLASSDRITG